MIQNSDFCFASTTLLEISELVNDKNRVSGIELRVISFINTTYSNEIIIRKSESQNTVTVVSFAIRY